MDTQGVRDQSHRAVVAKAQALPLPKTIGEGISLKYRKIWNGLCGYFQKRKVKDLTKALYDSMPRRLEELYDN